MQAGGQLRHVPVLLVTADASREDIARAVLCGAAGYIVKPFTAAALRNKLRQILARRHGQA